MADQNPAYTRYEPSGQFHICGPRVEIWHNNYLFGPSADSAGGSTGLLMDLAANEKAVHADFFSDFEDLFDDDNLD